MSNNNQPSAASSPSYQFGDFELVRRALIQDRDDLKTILRKAVKREKVCQVFVPYLSKVVQGHFYHVTDSRIHIVLENPLMQQHLPVMAACVVYFNSQETASTFLSWVKECKPGGGDKNPMVLSLDFPDSIAAMESRAVYRIPTTHIEDLDVKIEAEGRSFGGKVSNLSMGGALVAFEKAPALKLGQIVEIQLQFEGLEATVKGAVRWVSAKQIGFFFFEHVTGGEVVPPASYTGLFRKVERKYVQGRVDSAA